MKSAVGYNKNSFLQEIPQKTISELYQGFIQVSSKI